MRPIPQGEARTGPLRTSVPARTGQVSGDVQLSKEHWVAELAGEIRTAEAEGRTWCPDYDDLQSRTGYGRSWCEKTVRAARTQATRTPRTDGAAHTDEGPAARTGTTG